MEDVDIRRQASLLDPAIAAKIVIFAKRGSVVDAKFREDVLIRIVGVHDKFVSLSDVEFPKDNISISEIRRAEEVVRGMLRFLSVTGPLVHYIRFLSNVQLRGAYATCRQVFSRQRSSIFHVLQHTLVAQFLITQDSLFRVMDVLVRETDSHDLRKFQSTLAWAAAAWEGLLRVTEKPAIKADVCTVVYEHKLRLEHDLTPNNLSIRLGTPIGELLKAYSKGAETKNAGKAVVTTLEAELQRAQEESQRESRSAAGSDDDFADKSLSSRQKQQTVSKGRQDRNELERPGCASAADAEERLSLARNDLVDQRRQIQKHILGNMEAVSLVFEASNQDAQNAEQLLVIKEIQQLLKCMERA